MEVIMRAYIVIGALAILAIFTGIYAANTQIEQAPPGYKWAEQRGTVMPVTAPSYTERGR
jgi:hypothetical protein